MPMKRHPFDPISFVLGLFVTSLGLLFVLGDRSAGEIGARWLWPFPVVLAGLVAVLAALRMIRRSGPPHEELEADVTKRPDALDDAP
jgi:cytochrome c-type biogenesis protein CcmH/NrfF